MNKKLILAGGLTLLIIAIALFILLTQPSEFTAQLAMQSDAMAIVNYYQPRRIVLSSTPQEPQLKLPAFQSSQPLFGVLVIGNGADSLITVALDESKTEGFSFFYVDQNNNQDLTDDGEALWDGDLDGVWTKETLVDVHYKKAGALVVAPYPVSFYRYKNRLHDSIIAYRNGFREGKIALKDSTYKIALLDDNLNGRFDDRATALLIDSDRNGVLNGHADSPEFFSITEPFNISGVTYRVKHITPEGGTIRIEIADSPAPPKAALLEGMSAPAFEAIALNGETIALRDLRNKVVLLDFWAAWCKPWEADLPTRQRNYERYRHRDFEIIGVNLDFELDSLRAYLSTRKIEWPQIANGQGWQSPLVDLYGVTALPKNFLLDRKGVIRYKDLSGASLSAKIYELLNEPEIIN